MQMALTQARSTLGTTRRKGERPTSGNGNGTSILTNGAGYTEKTRGWPPMACSGSGVLLSGTAVATVNWRLCINGLHGTCAQADWMLGKCLTDHGIPVEARHGCSVCGLDCTALERIDAPSLQQDLRSGRCSFVQYPGEAEKRCDPAAKARVCEAIREGGAAASHGCRKE